MAKKGRVLREPYAGPGLMMVEGRQYPLMEELWRSQVPAKPGLAVNVDFDRKGNLRSITAVSEYEKDGQPDKVGLRTFGFSPRALEDATVATSLLIQFAAALLLLISWCSLTALSIHLPFSGNVELTFWQVLGFLNAGGLRLISEVAVSPDSGLLGFVALLVLAGPFSRLFFASRRAALGGFLPLGFIGCIAGMAYSNLRGGAFELVHPGFPQQIFKGISIGFGTYVCASLALYIAVLSARQFMGKGATSEGISKSQEVSA